MESVMVDGVELFLGKPSTLDMDWIGQESLLEQVLAAWAVIHEDDLPLSPRVLGPPGVGKTTLAVAAARKVNKDVYIFQCTADTRPEDLLVNPVVGSSREIRYHASPLVTAMIQGGACILDEGNRMPEKAWASLAPLLDRRRYIESIIAGVRIQAHPDFRIAVTMNQDASVFDVPEYISSRLQPKIHVPFPSKDDEMAILRYNLPFAPEDIISYVVEFLQEAHGNQENYSPRDGINIARYMLKLTMEEAFPLPDEVFNARARQAIEQVLGKDALMYIDRDREAMRQRVIRRMEREGFPFSIDFLNDITGDGDGDDVDDINDGNGKPDGTSEMREMDGSLEPSENPGNSDSEASGPPGMEEKTEKDGNSTDLGSREEGEGDDLP
ncbi:AAA domain-containing protein [Candidatus Bathyarchaeota archaeon]|nr:AAA domain-containing protein [Candidatus Bathyarchaeota archaeon]